MHNSNFNAANAGGNPYQPMSVGTGGGSQPQGYAQFNESNPEYQVAATKENKKSWQLWVKIASIIMMILGTLDTLFAVYNFIVSLVNWGSDAHDAHYSENLFGAMNVSLNGTVQIIYSLIDVIIPALVIYQGWLSYQTTQKDSSKDTSAMIKKIFMFIVVQIVLKVIQLVIVFLVITSAVNEGFNTSEASDEDKKAANTIVYSILATMFCCSFACTGYCCMSIWGMHHFYKRSQLRFEDATRNLNVGTQPPQIDYTPKQNQMV